MERILRVRDVVVPVAVSIMEMHPEMIPTTNTARMAFPKMPETEAFEAEMISLLVLIGG
jgi:DTW domain-containing protein YfiP